MKKYISINLMLIISSWCLLLNNKAVLSLIILSAAIVFMFFVVKKINYWRVATISIITLAIGYYLATVTIMNYFNFFTYFVILNSINIGIISEAILTLNQKILYRDTMIVVAIFAIFAFFASILPSRYAIGESKANLYGLILLIFMPYSSVFGFQAIKRYCICFRKA